MKTSKTTRWPALCAAALAIGATGCGDSAEPVVTADATVGSDTVKEPTPWIYDAVDTTATTSKWTGETIATATLSAAALAATLDPSALLPLHDLLLPPPAPNSGTQTGCPTILTYEQPGATGFFWQGECVRDDGTILSGRGTAVRYEDLQQDGATLSGFEISMAGTMTAPDGTTLEGTGNASVLSVTAQDFVGFAVTLDGTFEASGPRANLGTLAPWVDGTRQPSVTVSGWTYGPTGGRNLLIDGSVGGLGGLDGIPADMSAIAFEDFTVRELTAGNSCEREPGGLVALRDTDGVWTEVLFDGLVEDAPEPEVALCEGCGAQWLRGTGGEDVCLDPRPLLDTSHAAHMGAQ